MSADDDDVPGEARRDRLMAKVKILENRLRNTFRKDERERIACKKRDLEAEINSIRPKARVPEAKDHFIAAAREILPPQQFDEVMRLSVIRAGGLDIIGLRIEQGLEPRAARPREKQT